VVVFVEVLPPLIALRGRVIYVDDICTRPASARFQMNNHASVGCEGSIAAVTFLVGLKMNHFMLDEDELGAIVGT
jgi:hypothetical protein